MDELHFDDVIVGGGSAGCVLANRLSADGCRRVLLIEAGMDTPPDATQASILSELRANPKFNNLACFVIDFDSQKDLVNRFGVRMQSTLIAFNGEKEEGHSVGDTKRDSIYALVGKSL